MKKITAFIQKTLKAQKKQHVVLGISGGIDSTTSLYLLARAIDPVHIYVAHLYYFKSHLETLRPILHTLKVPQTNIIHLSIKTAVDETSQILGVDASDNVRLGNIMARTRMIFLYDIAKKRDALVCGTENKTEQYLGYFTRFGDEASDFEPIRHLYKTQVYELAKSLGVPSNIIDQAPTAGLWDKQTDEGEFGFSYEEADKVLYLYFEKKKSIGEIKKEGFVNAEKIIGLAKKNSYKHHVPYVIQK